jgi:hypothetical protein
MAPHIEPDQLDEVLWKIQVSLECAARWLDAGCDPKEAAGELRLNVAHLRELRGVGVGVTHHV